MKRRNAYFTAGVLIASIGILTTACSGKASDEKNGAEKNSLQGNERTYVPEEKQVLEFWHAMSGENGTVLEALVKKFNETHTNSEVVPVFQGHYRELFEKLNGAAQAGTLPALSMIYCNRLTAYVMNDLVEDLNPRIEDAKYGFDPVV